MEKDEKDLYVYRIESIIGSIHIVKSTKGLRLIEWIEEEWIFLNEKQINKCLLW